MIATYKIWRHRVNQKAFFRDRRGLYYAATPKVSDAYSGSMVSWVLKEIGKDEKIMVTTKDLANYYEACSPYEALGSALQ
jgi:hypothetical protein